MNINQQQIENVIRLSPEKRHEHFVKVVSDWEEVWGLYEDGWALSATEDGQTVFPLWPAREYAILCAEDEWKGYRPEAISLNDLIEELLPKLEQDNVIVGVFPTPQNKGITISSQNLQFDFSQELEKYA